MDDNLEFHLSFSPLLGLARFFRQHHVPLQVSDCGDGGQRGLTRLRRGQYSAEQYLARLRQHVMEPFLLAVSDQLHIDEAELEDFPAGIHRFRNMPLPSEVVRLGNELLNVSPAG
ncbi:MAG TPA: hypothetical protein VN688_21895 [Gemmataceae bacterium]|nr:hypothetical protein [Gemmataceae bacterium]